MAENFEAEVRAQIEASAGAIFDNDGTIVDTMPVHYRAFQVATKEHGLIFTEEEFYARAGATGIEIITDLNKAQGKSAVVEEVLASKRRHLLKEIHAVKPISAVIPLIEHARKCGIPVAVASGGIRRNVVASLKAVGFDPEKDFDAVVTADDVTKGKPHPETFLLAAQRIGVDPKKCVGFEDGDLGIEALHAAEMASVDVRKLPGYPLPDVLRKKMQTDKA